MFQVLYLKASFNGLYWHGRYLPLFWYRLPVNLFMTCIGCDAWANPVLMILIKWTEKPLKSIWRYYLKLGYRVERTRYVGDYGADLVVWKKGLDCYPGEAL